MTGYGGYFMQGMASGIPNLASQIQALKIKKEQKKEADKLKQEIADAISMFSSNNQNELDLLAPAPANYGGYDSGASPGGTNTPTGDLQYGKGMGYNEIMGNLPKIGSEGVLANPKLINFIATMSAVRESLGTTMKDIFIAIDRGNITEYEQKMDYAKNLINRITEVNMAGGDVNSFYGFPDVVIEESKQWFRVAEMYGKTPAANITPNMTADVSAMTGGIQQSTIDELRTLPAVQPQAPKISDHISAVNYLSKFVNATPEIFNKIKAGLQNQFPDLDLSNITQEALRKSPLIAEEDLANTKEGDDQYYQEIEETPKPTLLQKGVSAVKNWLGMERNQGVSPTGNVAASAANLPEVKTGVLYTPEINEQVEQDKKYTEQHPDSIAAIQKALKEKGYWDYAITGEWSTNLEKALRELYRDQQTQ